MTIDELVTRALDYGVIGLVLAFVGLVIWFGGSWVGKNLLLPAKEVLTEFIGDIRKNNDSLVQLQQQQTTMMGAVRKEVAETSKQVTEQAEAIKRIDKNVERLSRGSERFFDEAHREHRERQHSEQ